MDVEGVFMLLWLRGLVFVSVCKRLLPGTFLYVNYTIGDI